ncbi:MAG TPA: homoserine dehydrogenase [Ktedonobacteraceae bacterium]|nr:homoserine dehydrogenase [Ktedonobacteraceae bacterium]
MKHARLVLIGFGVVGQGFVRLLFEKQDLLKQRYDLDMTLVGVANARHGFIYREDGLDVQTLLELAAGRHPLTGYPDVVHWEKPLEGLRAIDADVLVEATPTNLRDAEPGMSHIRAALTRCMHVVTANKGPCALAAVELLEWARQHSVQMRMEATVMAGTPVLSTICEGMAGARVQSIRGILNGTTNYILSAMAMGCDYAEALADAHARGYAETDPTADVEGHDAVAKTLILAALVFGRSLKPGEVARQGITAITTEEVWHAMDQGKRIKLVASLRLVSGSEGREDFLEARVEPIALPLSDPLAYVDGVMNAISVQADTLSEVTISGPGAGARETGQGLLADVIACVRG